MALISKETQSPAVHLVENDFLQLWSKRLETMNGLYLSLWRSSNSTFKRTSVLKRAEDTLEEVAGARYKTKMVDGAMHSN